MEPNVPVLLGDAVRPARPAGLRRRLLGGQPAPHGALRRRRAGRAGGRLPGVRRAVTAPAADPRRRADRRQPRHRRSPRWPACAASRSCRTGCATSSRTCTVPVPRSTSPSSTRTGSWSTRRCRRGRTVALLLDRDGQEPAHGGHAVAVHPLLGAHVRLPEEPERHVWQADVGTDAAAVAGRPPDPRASRRFPVRPTARWRLPRPRVVFGEAPRSATSASSRCCCSTSRRRSRRSRHVDRAGRCSTSRSRPTWRANTSAGRPRCCMPVKRREQPRAYDIAALLAAHPDRLDGAEMRDLVRASGHPVRSGVRAVWVRPTPRTTVRRGTCSPRWRCPVASARSRVPTAFTRRCWTPASRVRRRALRCPGRRQRRAAAAAGRPPDCAASPPPATRTTATPGDERQPPRASRPTSTCSTSTERVLLTVEGLRLGSNGSPSGTPQPGAQRAAADHRVAAAGTARARTHRASDRGC